MPILNRDEYFSRLKEYIGEDSSDTAVSFLEDMTDTYNDHENRLAGDGVDWKKKYDELDATWTKRYRSRFFNGDSTYVPASSEKPDNGYDPNRVMVEDLFKEVN